MKRKFDEYVIFYNNILLKGRKYAQTCDHQLIARFFVFVIHVTRPKHVGARTTMYKLCSKLIIQTSVYII
jgi:hypothetical protein